MNHSGSLWLEREPSVEEVKNEFSKFDMNKYKEVVFCGFGEPTERLDDVLEVCRFIKDKYNKTIRINTNGLADLIHKKNTAPMFDGLIDIVSISLNTPNKERYLELTRSKFGIESFDAMIKFAENVKHYVKEVVLSTVSTTLTEEEEKELNELCLDKESALETELYILTTNDTEGKETVDYTDDFGDDNVERFNKGMEAVQALQQGKIDAVIIDNQPAKTFVEENESLKILETSYVEEDYALAIKKGNDDLVKKVNDAIKELKEDGTFDKIVAKYITD